MRGGEPGCDTYATMATKKQRRRRAKLQRHEYEYVVETEEGEEVVEAPVARTSRTTEKTPNVVDRRGREIKPPSWNRVLKRGAIFGPLLVLFIFLTGSSLTTGAKIFNAVIMLAIFLPFSYLVDVLIYRSVMKRQRQNAGR
jgi:hypothetical protein